MRKMKPPTPEQSERIKRSIRMQQLRTSAASAGYERPNTVWRQAVVEEGRKNIFGASAIEILNSPKIGMITVELPAELIGKTVEYMVWEKEFITPS